MNTMSQPYSDLELPAPRDAPESPPPGPFAPLADAGEGVSEPPPRQGLIRYLRWAGTLLLALGVVDFLVEGIAHVDPSYRAWIVPGAGVLLAACGLVSGRVWKDTVGARLFFGLATTLLPIQACQLGTMINTAVNGYNPLHPGWWQYEGLTTAFIGADLVLSIALFAPICHTGMAILARPHARRLTALLFLGSAFLLLPVRAPLFTAGVAALLFVYLHSVDRRVFLLESAMRLVEGRAARAIVWTPVAVLIGRGLFHPLDGFSVFVLTALAGCGVMQYLRPQMQSVQTRILVELAGIALPACGWVNWVHELTVQLALAPDTAGALASLPIAAALIGVAPRLAEPSLTRLVAAGLACLTVLMLPEGFTSSVVGIASGIALGAVGVQYRERVPALLGIVTFGAGIVAHLHYLMELYRAAPSLSLAGLGICLLLLASYLQKRGPALWQTMREHFR
jgi:hypothetical protein